MNCDGHRERKVEGDLGNDGPIRGRARAFIIPTILHVAWTEGPVVFDPGSGPEKSALWIPEQREVPFSVLPGGVCRDARGGFENA